jgi:hypothetical protein
MEIQLFNSIFFWKKYFKELLKIFIIELKEKFHYNYLKLIILYPGLCSIFLIIVINMCSSISASTAPLFPLFLTNYDTDISIALSGGTFEPNPEYLYLYRLERKIELINLLIQKIKDKNPTHLNWNLTKTTFVNLDELFNRLVEHHSRMFFELFKPTFPLATEVIKFNSRWGEQICRSILEIMLEKDSVKNKFDWALKTITVTNSPLLANMSETKYDYKLLFEKFKITIDDKEKEFDGRGLTTFSEGFQNYSYVDLCTLEYFVGLIVWALILHYWILPENLDAGREFYFQINCMDHRNYFLYIDDQEFTANMLSWKRSESVNWLIKSLLDINLDAMSKEDSYRLVILADALMFCGRDLQPRIKSIFLVTLEEMMEYRMNGGDLNLGLIEKEWHLMPVHVARTTLRYLFLLIFHAR